MKEEKRHVAIMMLALAVVFAPRLASAGPILAPGTVIANTMGEFDVGFGVDGLFDQSGLSAAYISGVTDFATFMAATTHTRSPDLNGWLSSGPGVLPGQIDFDLGAAFSINQLGFWNHAAGSSANIQNFRVFTSNDALFGSAFLAGSFVNPQQDAFNPYPGQTYDLADSVGRYWRLQIDSYYGNSCCVAVGEVALDAESAAVPEPASLLLIGSGLFGLAARRRRVS